MGVQLYSGDLRQRSHERRQLDELIGAIKKDLVGQHVYIFYPVETKNGDIDCVIVLMKGIVAIDLKNYTGEIRGVESGPWTVTSSNGEEVLMHNNLYRQLKEHRFNIIDFLNRFRARFDLLDRIDPRELRKVSAWGYFNRGSNYDINQLKTSDESIVAPWFKITTAETICESLREIDLDYTLKHREIRNLAMRLHLKRDEIHSDPMPMDPDELSYIEPSGIGGPAPAPPIIEPSQTVQVERTVPDETAIIDQLNPFLSVETAAPADDGGNAMTPDIKYDEEGPSEEALVAISTLRDLAANGHAPLYRCGLFGIGYEDKLNLLEMRYLQKALPQGDSAEKFIVGEFGSGKTHFLSQLLERAKAREYATALVKLDINADMLSYNFILSRICSEIIAPSSQEKGLENLLLEVYKQVLDSSRSMTGGDEGQANELVDRWLDKLKGKRFEHTLYSFMVVEALQAYRQGDLEKYQNAIRWLSGTISDARIAGIFKISKYPAKVVQHESRNILLSLYQFIKYASLNGTVVAFDETDQNWRKITPKHRQLFNSLLQSEVNMLVDTKDVSVLITYALVPELYENMMQYPALQNRLQPVNPKYTFERGYADCPIIVVSRPSNITKDEIKQELVEIGKKIVDLLYRIPGDHHKRPREDIYSIVGNIADLVVQEDLSSSNRRTMVKWVALVANRFYYDGVLEDPADLKADVAKEEEEE